jgi:hypothetical protein
MKNTTGKSTKQYANSSAKKEQFQQGKPRRNKTRLYVTTFILIAGIALVSGYYFMQAGGSEAGGVTGDQVLAERSYIGEFISMTAVEATIDGDWLTIPLEAVDRNSIVYFEAENDEGFVVPLMAYVGPSGRIFAGSSMCEPCRGRTFSLAGDTLVCDTCRTTYTLEQHEFITGSPVCGKYPPVSMDPVIEDSLVKIPLINVLSWRIRAL